MGESKKLLSNRSSASLGDDPKAWQVAATELFAAGLTAVSVVNMSAGVWVAVDSIAVDPVTPDPAVRIEKVIRVLEKAGFRVVKRDRTLTRDRTATFYWVLVRRRLPGAPSEGELH
jgi:hypothetical protein